MSDIQFEPEGKGLERKRVDATNESVLRAVVAFANSAGGDVAVGVDDDGTLLGVGDPIAVE
jgi:ATP-dependent DNA helicase RecG